MNVPDLKRIAYFNGQRLTAADMTDAQDATRELRWLHNRSLHGWGIASGLQVTGAVGDRAVTVSPGYALDCGGHEIILDAAKTVAAPASFSRGAEVEFYLVAIWVDDDRQQVLMKRDGACSGNGAVRLKDSPLLAWRSQSDLNEGTEVILATVFVQNCRISRAISASARRYARLSQQPYIASGQIAATSLNWEPIPSAQNVLGWQAEVDTSAAQFGAAPQYFVNVEGNRYVQASPGPLMAVLVTAASNPRANGFTLQLLAPQGSGIVNPPAIRDAAQWPVIVKSFGWQVVWMGVED